MTGSDGSDVATFAVQVCNYPVILFELDACEAECEDFAAREPTAEKNGQDRIVAPAAKILMASGGEQGSPWSAVSQFPSRTPMRRTAFTRRMPGSFRFEQAGVGSFIRDAADRCEPKVDCRRRLVTLLEVDPVSKNNSSVEGQPRL